MATQDAAFAGGRIAPCWYVHGLDTPWPGEGIPILLANSPGFGTGSHPTTQLCMRGLAVLAPKGGKAWRMLDFGSGSGILALGAAKLGATVSAVEIDPPSVASLRHNAELNGVADRLVVGTEMGPLPEAFDMVIANILKPVLLAFAGDLVARLAPGGHLLLSGLVPVDVPEISQAYGALLGGQRPEVYRQGDWVALHWRRPAEA